MICSKINRIYSRTKKCFANIRSYSPPTYSGSVAFGRPFETRRLECYLVLSLWLILLPNPWYVIVCFGPIWGEIRKRNLGEWHLGCKFLSPFSPHVGAERTPYGPGSTTGREEGTKQHSSRYVSEFFFVIKIYKSSLKFKKTFPNKRIYWEN